MTEAQFCAFVERWNDCIESIRKSPRELAYRIWTNVMLDMLDDLMATFDADAPQWVEASAVASDGTRYWARVDQRDYKPIMTSDGRFQYEPIDQAWCDAQLRAEYLANRGAS